MIVSPPVLITPWNHPFSLSHRVQLPKNLEFLPIVHQPPPLIVSALSLFPLQFISQLLWAACIEINYIKHILPIKSLHRLTCFVLFGSSDGHRPCVRVSWGLKMTQWTSMFRGSFQVTLVSVPMLVRKDFKRGEKHHTIQLLRPHDCVKAGSEILFYDNPWPILSFQLSPNVKKSRPTL